RIAWRHFHAGLLLPRFDVLAVHMRAGFQIGEIAQAWDVYQHAAGDNSILEVVDTELASLGGRRFVRVVVIEPPLVRHVAQRVQMRESPAVRIDVDTFQRGLPLPAYLYLHAERALRS